MPGKHYKLTASRKEIKWSKIPENSESPEKQKTRKEVLVEFMKKYAEEYKTSSTAMVWVGATAPGAAVLLKKSGEKVPQVKKLRMDLVPNVVFVPALTMLSLIAVRMLHVAKTSRTTS
ncbi:hypothetical protein BHE74_00006893 [Ensete ventricosum]|nr:hypothetical protein GW17_00009640 [Ensete ventricosum]RWW84498.1 hypothetical protein BHE74_00006893 [Ensete ventricosum]RZR96857.1 hypothetical protein BHM03_00025950 [Ensete ventricosum]